MESIDELKNRWYKHGESVHGWYKHLVSDP
jgi:hypothetical protein